MAKPMESKPLYFDNAATSYPKPEAVYLACDQALRTLGSAGRGGHRLALEAGRTMFEGREAVGQFFDVSSERIVFASGCTAAINLVLNGLVGAGRLHRGETVICSSYEHNAVMRPLRWLEQHHDIRVVKIAPAKDHRGLIDLKNFQELIAQHQPSLCILNGASNVTGEILDLAGANEICSQHTLPLLVDGAQIAGARALCLSDYPAVSFFAASAHKAMLGPPGLGVLYVGEDQLLDPSFCGGTGSRSESLDMPRILPDRLEPGTPAPHLVAGLTAALAHLNEKGPELHRREAALAAAFAKRIAELPRIKVYGRPRADLPGQDVRMPSHLPTFALSLAGVSADVAADRLDREFDMATRPGLHCAVSAHETLGTSEKGLLRVSFGACNSEEEIDALCRALDGLRPE